VLGCPFNAEGIGVAAGAIRPTATDAPFATRLAIERRSRAGGHGAHGLQHQCGTTWWYRFQSDTGLQAAYTDPINPLFNAISSQPLYSFAAGYTHIFNQRLVNYFNPAFSWYESLFGPADSTKTLAAFPIVLQGAGSNAPFTTLGGLDTTGCRGDGRRGSRSTTVWRWTVGPHQFKFGISSRRLRINDYDFSTYDTPLVNTQPWRSSSTAWHPRRPKLSPGRLAAIQLPQPGPIRAGHHEADVEADLDDRRAHGAPIPTRRARTPDCAPAGSFGSRRMTTGSAPRTQALATGLKHVVHRRRWALWQPRTAIAWQFAPGR
jgi:hypothetical protein